MLATLVIGLREGLEAALIVGIIAAFLRNNGKSLVPMWLGVVLAVLLSIAVGVGLKLIEQALPQAAQEGLETVIGVVAVFFVTGMIVWMHNHARDLKKQLEADAAQALGRASTYALASMAFLAVLKEGFETSVFLLATFSVAQSAIMAAAGAIAGILLAIVIGWGIYVGGVKLNLSRFFRYTAAFLILVAAGLVVSSLRTAHEAGWLNAGQQTLMNLDWLVAPGTVQSALITGVLGIPADPRLIEVLGWLAYLIPVTLYLYWPQAQRPGPRAAAWLKTGVAATALIGAAGLAMGYPEPQPQIPGQAPLITTAGGTSQSAGSASLSSTSSGNPTVLHVDFADAAATSLPLPEDKARQTQHEGVTASMWEIKGENAPTNAPATLTLQQVVDLTGGRIPIGLDPRQHPGPYNATWSIHHVTRIWQTGGVLLDAARRSATTVTLSGSSLSSPRTLKIDGASGFINAGGNWHASPEYVNHVVRQLDAAGVARMERHFWAFQLPILLAITALVLILLAWRELSRLSVPPKGDNSDLATRTGHRDDEPENQPKTKGATHAA